MRHFYHCALDSVDMDAAVKLIEEMGAVVKLMRGEDPDYIDPDSWFEQNSVKKNG